MSRAPRWERIRLYESVCVSDTKKASTTDHDTAECDEQGVEAISPLAFMRASSQDQMLTYRVVYEIVVVEVKRAHSLIGKCNLAAALTASQAHELFIDQVTDLFQVRALPRPLSLRDLH